MSCSFESKATNMMLLDQQHQQQAKCSAQIGIVALLELALDDVADEHRVGAAQLLGNVEGGNGGHEDHGDAGKDAGNGKGQDHPPVNAHKGKAVNAGRLLQIYFFVLN